MKFAQHLDNANITELAKSLVKASDELKQYKEWQDEANKRVEKAQEGYQKALKALTDALVQGGVENVSDAPVECSEDYVIDHSNEVGDNSIDNLQIVSRSTLESRVTSCLERVIGEFNLCVNLKDELDSLDMLEFVLALEERFDIEIPDDDAEKFWNSKRVITLEDIAEKMSKLTKK